MKEKIFVSHSSVDAELAKEFVNLLKHGVGIKSDRIFCSSVDGSDIPIGVNFIEFIKRELDTSSLVLALVTSNYYNSRFCMYELGASWVQCDKVIPILFPPLEFGNLKDFLANIMAIKVDDPRKLNKLSETLKFYSENDTTRNNWEDCRENFLRKIKEIKDRPQHESPVSPSLRVIKNPYRYKVIAFDLDGTMLQGSDFDYSWRHVWKYLGYDDEERKVLLRRHVGNPNAYPYEQWCKDCAEKFKAKGLKKSDIRKIVREIDKLHEATGLRVLLSILKSQGFITAVISGGIDTFYEYGIKPKTKQHIDQVYINRFLWNPDGTLKEVIPMEGVISDFSGKTKILERICANANCNIDQAVYVGEGFNDVEVASSPCLAIAYPAKKADQRYKIFARQHINDANICYILPYILELENK